MTSEIEKAIEEAIKWMDYEGVEGIGQGRKDDKDCIIVLISHPDLKLYSKMPREFNGFPVVFQKSGQIDVY